MANSVPNSKAIQNSLKSEIFPKTFKKKKKKNLKKKSRIEA
jgi:hypothetical protein